ncbi:MAG: hypothetical protein KF884_11255 [Fimbriimonadaceae bacterium]|nr:hypothetical protein [Fimbriimonadaceae bacterium]QYK58121.1 MAG: hypothetical protein KF884_11255 [Fimbriimonadaceae bacterium]
MTASIVVLALTTATLDPIHVDMPIESVGGIKLERGSKRPLVVRATFPKTGGPYPVIVFSHGMYGSGEAVMPITDEFARHGYSVFAPTHGDSLRYADASTVRGALQGRLDNVSSWSERPGEVSFLIDRLETLEGLAPGLKGKIDADRIGVGGHSFGAWTAQVVAGMTLARSLTMADPRPQAFLVISPTGIGAGISESSLKAMRGPLMMISGDNDRGRFEGDPSVYRRQAFEHASPGDKYLVWIDGAYHNFGGINGRSTEGRRPLVGGELMGPGNRKHVEAVFRTSVAFWDAHLKSDKSALKWLQQDGWKELEGVTVSSK